MPSAPRFLKGRIFIPVLMGAMLVAAVVRAETFTVVNTADSGDGSLRAAISNANFFAGSDLIHFAIPGSGPFTINLATVLPSLTDTATIDGTTQPGYAGKPLIELNGASAAGNGSGIYLLAPDCVVKGLAVNRFSSEGIHIGANGAVVQANFIGTGPFGTNALGNGGSANGFGGIRVESSNNLIGGTNAADGNVISGNRHGIFIWTAAATSNQVMGNFIGTDVTGTKRIANTNNGVTISSGAMLNVIGGTNFGARNLISGNGQSGVYILDPITVSNSVLGNFIGTDVAGSSALNNNADGVTIYGGVANAIGGASVGARNVISGNGNRGVLITPNTAHDNFVRGNYIGTDATGLLKVANNFSGVEIQNAYSNYVGGIQPGDGNLISGNGLSGVSLSTNATLNFVCGNYIGTDASGSNALSNARGGVDIFAAATNTIGGATAGARNVIAGNAQNGVLIGSVQSRGNVIQGNFIGTDVNGTRRLPNGFSGVRVEAPANLIGGSATGSRNIISGNNNSGIYLFSSSASNNVVQGNFVGTTALGTAALMNAYGGVGFLGAPANQIGGAGVGEGNLISGNNLNGMFIQTNANANIIQGNYIGTDVTGMNGIPNGGGLPISDGAGGIDIAASAANQIGGSAAGAGNLIAANFRDAIAIGDPGASNNVIKGNWVGVKADGVSPLGNEWHGVEIRNTGGGLNTIIGGTEPGAGNILAFATLSQRSGVRIRPGTGNTGIFVRGNSIFFNGSSGATGLGIDIGTFGVNLNDNCDSDSGPNLQQNYPVLTSAESAANVTIVRGRLNSAANKTYLLQFYANPVPEPSGLVEGKIFLGDAMVTTDGSCNAEFTAILTNGTPAGSRITATATDAANNTSEFSLATIVSLGAAPVITLAPQNQSVPFGSNVTFTVSATGAAPLAYQWLHAGTNIPGAIGTALNLANVQPADGGLYSVNVSNVFAITNASAQLTVLGTSPTLTARLFGTDLALSWPLDGPAFTVQAATNLSPPVYWNVLTNTPVISNGEFTVFLPITNASGFFRLAWP